MHKQLQEETPLQLQSGIPWWDVNLSWKARDAAAVWVIDRKHFKDRPSHQQIADDHAWTCSSFAFKIFQGHFGRVFYAMAEEYIKYLDKVGGLRMSLAVASFFCSRSRLSSLKAQSKKWTSADRRHTHTHIPGIICMKVSFANCRNFTSYYSTVAYYI